MENATTVFLVLSFDFETCPRLNRGVSFLKSGGVERFHGMFQCFYRYVQIYIYILEIFCVLGEKKETGND